MAEASSIWNYPGTWIANVVAVVLEAGGITMAVVLRRILRKPPLPPEPPQSPSLSPEKKHRPHE